MTLDNDAHTHKMHAGFHPMKYGIFDKRLNNQLRNLILLEGLGFTEDIIPELIFES